MKKGNASIMHVGDIILTASEEAVINENWCLLNNQSTCNAFINVKYLLNIRYAPNGQYLRVHCIEGVIPTSKIGDLPRYSDPVWYNPNGISNILYLGLVQNNHILTYNIQDGNEFVIQILQRTTFKMNNYGIFYHDMRHLVKNKYAHIMVNYSCSPIPKSKDKKKGYTSSNIKISNRARRFKHITVQPINQIFHAVDNNILKNLPIQREYVGMAEDIYGPSIQHLKCKQCSAIFNMWSLLRYQIFLKSSLISTRRSPFAVISCI